jgi:hypothetical protein
MTYHDSWVSVRRTVETFVGEHRHADALLSA